MKVVGKAILIILAVFVSALLVVFLLHRPSNRVIAQWQQSGTINYQSFDPYFLSVVERDKDYSSFPFHVERNYFIYVGRGSGQPSYGHVIKFSFHPSDQSIEEHIKKSVVEWSKEGVTFKELSGHVLFIPKKMFIGGR